MRNIIFAFLALVMATTWGCEKDTLDNIEQIEFGYTNFAWGANCQRFQLTPEKLYTTSQGCVIGDTTLHYDIQLSADRFNVAKRLLEDLPEDIFTGTDEYFQTDCNDCGGYYLKIKKGSTVKAVQFTEILNDDWPDYAQKSFRLVASTVRDLR